MFNLRINQRIPGFRVAMEDDVPGFRMKPDGLPEPMDSAGFAELSDNATEPARPGFQPVAAGD